MKFVTRCSHVTIISIFVLALAACGGGSGGGGPVDEDLGNNNGNEISTPGDGGDSGFTVSGNVIGLTGAGLILLINDNESLDINNNGDFSFGSTFSTGDSYHVVVSNQPTGQSCAVENGMEEIDTADVTNVTVSCTEFVTSWGDPLLIGGNALGESSLPRVAIDPSGNIIAAWLENDGTSTKVVASRFVEGAGWGDSTVISDGANENFAKAPEIAIDNLGNAIAVWQQEYAGRQSVWSNYFSVDSSWGTAQLLESSDTESAGTPQIAFRKSTGDAIVVWSQNLSSIDGPYIWANHYSIASGWSGPNRIENTGGHDPQIAINDSGATMVIYEGDNIRAIHYNSVDGWGNPINIHDDSYIVSGAPYTPPSFAMDDSGSAVVAWEGIQGAVGFISIWASHYTPGAGWADPVVLESYEDENAIQPKVVIDSSGIATVTWSQSAGTSENRVLANRFDPINGWGDAQIVSDTSIDRKVLPPQLDIDGEGNVVILYEQRGELLDDTISFVRYTQGLGWLAGEALSSNDVSEFGSFFGLATYNVAFNFDGEGVAVWSQRNDTTLRFDIWVSQYR